MLSLIPWGRLLELSKPFIKDVFFGKYSIFNYFERHKLISALVVTILFLLCAFTYLSYATERLYIRVIYLEKIVSENKIEKEEHIKLHERKYDQGPEDEYYRKVVHDRVVENYQAREPRKDHKASADIGALPPP